MIWGVAVLVLVALLVLGRLRRRRQRKVSTEALAQALGYVDIERTVPYRHRPYRGRWWL